MLRTIGQQEGVGEQPDLDQAVQAADGDVAQPSRGGRPGPAAAEGGEVVLTDQRPGRLSHERHRLGGGASTEVPSEGRPGKGRTGHSRSHFTRGDKA